jgi:4'-phosphopantetheinyl transferase
VKEVSWLLVRAEEVPADDGWLTPAERIQLAALTVPPRRADWRLGRWAAKHALAAFLGVSPDSIEIRTAPDGAPEAFLGGRPAPAALSLSHRAGRALCAVAPAGTALGCDLELIEPRSDLFVQDFFTTAERAVVDRAPAAERPRLANLLWSAKESALKALRTGLTLDTRSVEVRLLDAGAEAAEAGWSPLAVHSRDTAETFSGGWRQDDGFVLTVATGAGKDKILPAP